MARNRNRHAVQMGIEPLKFSSRKLNRCSCFPHAVTSVIALDNVKVTADELWFKSPENDVRGFKVSYLLVSLSMYPTHGVVRFAFD